MLAVMAVVVAANLVFNPFGSTALNLDSSVLPGAPAGSQSRYDCWLTRF